MRKMVGQRSVKARRTFALLAVTPILSGCVALGGVQPTSDTFDLSAPVVANAQSVRRGTQVLVVEPAALQVLDSENIVIETEPLTIQYLDEARWGDRLPRLVQRRLAEAFESADRFAGVGLPGQGLAIDYQVITDIRRFGIDAAAGVAEVEIAVKLLNDRNGTIVADRVFSAAVPVSSAAGASRFVVALNTGFASVAEDIVVWVSRLV